MNCQNQQCEQFGAELGSKKFCNKCGTPTSTANLAASPGSTFSSKNVVSGDQRITNTTVVNQDETTSVKQCAISGRQAQPIEGYVCPSCSQWVHGDFYDLSQRRCVRCRDEQSAESEQEFREAVSQVFADGIATKEETEHLQHLGSQLGLTGEKQKEIISEVRSLRTSARLMSVVNHAKLKTALVGLRDLRFDSKGAFAKRNQALATLRVLHANYPSDEQVAALYVLGSAIQFISLSGMEMIQHLVRRAQEEGKLPSAVPDDIELDSSRLQAAQQSAAQCFADARDVIKSSEAFTHDSAYNLLAQATFARAISLFFINANDAFGGTAAMEEEESESFRAATAALEAGFSDSLEWANLQTAVALDEFYASNQTEQAQTELNQILHGIGTQSGNPALEQSLAGIRSKCESNNLNFFSLNIPQELSEEAALFFTLLYAVNANTIHSPSSLSHIWWLTGVGKHLQAFNLLTAEERAQIEALPPSEQLTAIEKITSVRESGGVPQVSLAAATGVTAPIAEHDVAPTLPAGLAAPEAGPSSHARAASSELAHVQNKLLASSYFVMLLSLPTLGAAGVLAAGMAYLAGRKSKGSWLASHVQWQLRSFWYSCFWAFVATLGWILLFDGKAGPGPLFLLAWVWYYYRALKGRKMLRNNKPAYEMPAKRVFMKATAGALVTLASAGFLADKLKPNNKVRTQSSDPQNIALDSSQLVEVQQRAEDAEAEVRRLQAVAEAAEKEAARLKAEASNGTAPAISTFSERAIEPSTAATEQSSTTREADLQQAAGSYMQEAERLEKSGEWIQITSNPSFGAEVLDYDEAKRRAEEGDAYAQAVVSIYYSTGYKTAKDTRQGLSYALQSAEQGHPLGAYRLGVILQEGEGGISADPAEGVRLKSRAVEGLNNMSGDPYAMTALGILLFRGEVLKKDQQMATQLYRRAAEMGYAPAQYTYSACLLFGRGVPKDQDQGMRYWKAAYDQGYSYALQGPPK